MFLTLHEAAPAREFASSFIEKPAKKWKLIAKNRTDENGRCGNLMEDGKPESGTYRLVFHAAEYFHLQNTKTFYSEIPVIFEIGDPNQHYHVPLLISPFGYSTYRGS